MRGGGMSSVLIRGMKMPKNCLICPCLEYNMVDDNIDGYCKILKTEITNSDKRHPNCPLIEISFDEEQIEIVNKMLKERG
jgi:hypothetical protein